MVRQEGGQVLDAVQRGWKAGHREVAKDGRWPPPSPILPPLLREGGTQVRPYRHGELDDLLHEHDGGPVHGGRSELLDEEGLEAELHGEEGHEDQCRGAETRGRRAGRRRRTGSRGGRGRQLGGRARYRRIGAADLNSLGGVVAPNTFGGSSCRSRRGGRSLAPAPPLPFVPFRSPPVGRAGLEAAQGRGGVEGRNGELGAGTSDEGHEKERGGHRGGRRDGARRASAWHGRFPGRSVTCSEPSHHHPSHITTSPHHRPPSPSITRRAVLNYRRH